MVLRQPPSQLRRFPGKVLVRYSLSPTARSPRRPLSNAVAPISMGPGPVAEGLVSPGHGNASAALHEQPQAGGSPERRLREQLQPGTAPPAALRLVSVQHGGAAADGANMGGSPRSPWHVSARWRLDHGPSLAAGLAEYEPSSAMLNGPMLMANSSADVRSKGPPPHLAKAGSKAAMPPLLEVPLRHRYESGVFGKQALGQEPLVVAAAPAGGGSGGSGSRAGRRPARGLLA